MPRRTKEAPSPTTGWRAPPMGVAWLRSRSRGFGGVGVLMALAGLCVAGGLPAVLAAQEPRATIREEVRVLDTYPFSEPNPVPILTSDERLYPYHRFIGYAHDAEPREWTVVHLENEWIELWVLPEIGGKVWGARVKASGHEFVYRNEVVKFRNIALRGPWTSGGIEFNFGVVGHTPATATPVDWLTRENDDGSVSVFVGATDLPSRTRWRVEVRLPADAAFFETRALWHNPTPLEQPYYNWMTGAAYARDDLVLSVPGDAYLEHPGAERAWPVDAEGRDLSVYDDNRFGGSKSYHVVGALEDFFGGYYAADDWGFGHWAPHEEMPGQKIWLWALSRQGGIWEDLLTDTDGQYMEFQAGRLLVQYTPGDDVTPVTQVGFDPGATDRWAETWFPVEALGGLTDASRSGAMHVERAGGALTVRAHAFGASVDTLRVTEDGREVAAFPLSLDVLDPVSRSVTVSPAARVVVELPALDLRWDSDPEATALSRPLSTEPEAARARSEADRRVAAAGELRQGGRLAAARREYEAVLEEEPWHREALLGLADAEYRRGRWEAGLEHARRALQLDTYDAEANFAAARLYRAAGHLVDARESYGWAARSMAFRSVAYTQLAELALLEGDAEEAERYAWLATDYDRGSLAARRTLALAARLRGGQGAAEQRRAELEALDPLDHFGAAERYVADRDSAAGAALLSRLRGEYPEQEILELAIGYAAVGQAGDAVALLELRPPSRPNAVLTAWQAYLADDPSLLAGGADVAFAFPFRPESIEVLRWAAEHDPHWSWRYLLALALWGRDRPGEALALLDALDDEPEFAPLYVVRAHLGTAGVRAERSEAIAAFLPPLPADTVAADSADTTGADAATAADSLAAVHDPEADLRHAVALDSDTRALRFPLLRFLQAAGRWEDALEASAEARERFPNDFDLDLVHVESLVATQRWRPAIEILDRIRVLPSEHAGISHQLFAHAHTMAALDALEVGAPTDAIISLETAMTWPEHLGLGRPYEPEERLQRYLLGWALRASGDEEGARAAFEEVVRATPADRLGPTTLEVTRLELLTAAALDALGRYEELFDFGGALSGGPIARLAAVTRSAATAGRSVTEALAEAALAETELLSDVEGRLLYRALELGLSDTSPTRRRPPSAASKVVRRSNELGRRWWKVSCESLVASYGGPKE